MRSKNEVTDIQFARAHIADRDWDLRLLRSDLHDSVGPLLSAVTMRSEAARAMITRDPEAAKEMLGELHADACSALAEVRRLACTEVAFASAEANLASALHRQADRFTRASGGRLSVQVAVASTMPAVRPAIKTAVYLIASEALTNTARHARATSCTIRTWVSDGELHLEVTDDGVGLPRRPVRGTGLNSMRDRALALRGTCVVENVVPHGTRVYAAFPIHPARRRGER